MKSFLFCYFYTSNYVLKCCFVIGEKIISKMNKNRHLKKKSEYLIRIIFCFEFSQETFFDIHKKIVTSKKYQFFFYLKHSFIQKKLYQLPILDRALELLGVIFIIFRNNKKKLGISFEFRSEIHI